MLMFPSMRLFQSSFRLFFRGQALSTKWIREGTVGDFDVDLFHEFFQGFVNHALVTLHIDNIRGKNAHHQTETIFKAFGRAALNGC